MWAISPVVIGVMESAFKLSSFLESVLKVLVKYDIKTIKKLSFRIMFTAVVAHLLECTCHLSSGRMNTSCFLAQAPHPWVFCWGSRAGSGRGIPPWSSSPETPREAPEGPWSSLCCMIKQVALINCLPSQQEIQGLDHDLGSAGCAFHQGPDNQTAVWCIGLWLGHCGLERTLYDDSALLFT